MHLQMLSFTWARSYSTMPMMMVAPIATPMPTLAPLDMPSLPTSCQTRFCFSDGAAGDNAENQKNAEADSDANAYLSGSGKAVVADFVHLGVGDTCWRRGTLWGDLKGIRVNGDENSFDHCAVDFGDFDTFPYATRSELLVEIGGVYRSVCDGCVAERGGCYGKD